jgi:hypothetical protein
MTLKSDTQTVRLPVDAATAYAFIANPQNLPTWAVGFCRAIERDGNSWIVETAGGHCGLDVEADAERRTIDFHMRPAPAVTLVAFSRVLACLDGCEYVFTQFGVPSMPDEAFNSSVAALKEELIVLRAALKARSACSVG